MNVLWIVNIDFPEAVSLLQGDKNSLSSSGGWMLGAANSILRYHKGVNLCVASVSRKVNELTYLEGESISYFMLPYGKGNNKPNNDYISLWKDVHVRFSPDITHIHGTEYTHGLDYIEACGYDNVVISIQGLISSCGKYYHYGLSLEEIICNWTVHDILRGGILSGKRRFKHRAKYELEMLHKVKHVIGRTSWDKANVLAINPSVVYHYCNESLRDYFYKGIKWDYNKCNKHSIFVSQASYPLKGLHMLLKAFPLILKNYPDAYIVVGGMDITRQSEGLKGRLRLNGYGKLLIHLTKQFNLADHIHFIGNLNEEQMAMQYLNCNVFVCPSTVENSPNSLGEAQILGVPVMASYVGGIPDMMKGDEAHLYRFEEITMLAKGICDIFAAGENQTDMTKIAASRHDRQINAQRLLSIYKEIISECK